MFIHRKGKNMKKIITFISILLLAGCLHNSEKSQTASLVDYLYPKDKPYPQASDEVVFLSLPLRVGLSFVPQSFGGLDSLPSGIDTNDIPESEKQRLLEVVASKFTKLKYVQSIEVIPQTYLPRGKGLEAIDQVSRMFGLDMMAFISYDQNIKAGPSVASILDLTIVGSYLPTNRVATYSFVDLAVIDSRTKKLLIRAPGIHENHSTIATSTYKKDAVDLKNKDFGLAIEKMTENLSKELGKFEDKIKNKKLDKIKLKYKKGYSSSTAGGSVDGMFFVAIFILGMASLREKNS